MRKGLKNMGGMIAHLAHKNGLRPSERVTRGSVMAGGRCLIAVRYGSSGYALEGFLMVSERHLRLLAARCIGRRNDYALQQEDGRYKRVGVAVSLAALARHVAGVETIGSYVIDEANTCHFAVFDADSFDGLVQLLAVQRRLSVDGIDSALEGSRRGGHLRVFFASAVAPGLVRRWLLPYCPDGVEFYPKQDAASFEHPGALMRVPFGVHRLSGRRYPFLQRAGAGSGDRLVPAARSVAASLEWLASLRRVPVPVRETSGLRDGTRPHTHTYVATGAGGVPASLDSATPVNIHDWCDRQDALRVIGRYVQLDRRGMGCCPFGWHHDDGKDAHPSLWVHPPRSSGAPCWYCYAWRRGGNLFDFLCLWYGVSSREMWRRILAGEPF